MTTTLLSVAAMRSRCVGALLTAVASLCAAGCGGGGAGLDIQKSAAERPDLTASASSAGRFLIPAEVAYNITSFKSGQTGSARGASEPVGTTGAVCHAEARDGGSAWGELQLGYCLDNATGRPLQAVAKVKVRVKGAISAEQAISPQAGKSSASNNLAFFIKDSYGLVVRQEQLFTQDLEKGPGATTAAHDLVFEVLLEPDRGYYFVLSGRCDAQAVAAQSVNCSLEAAEYGIELTWRAAPLGRSPTVSSPPVPTSLPASQDHPLSTP